MLMSVRDRLIRNQTQLGNAIRGFAAELGVTAVRGIDQLPSLLDRLEADDSLPTLARELFASQAKEYAQLQVKIADVDAKLAGEWVALIDLEPKAYGTHSLRRTKVAMLYKKTGNLRACQLLLGHRKLESTVRYLGIEVDDALALSEQVDL